MNVKQLFIYIVPPIFLVPLALFFFVWSINSSIETNQLIEEQNLLYQQQKSLYQPQAFLEKTEIAKKIKRQFVANKKVVFIRANMMEDTIINKFKILAMLDKNSVKYSNIYIELFGQAGLVQQYFKALQYDVNKMQQLTQSMNKLLQYQTQV